MNSAAASLATGSTATSLNVPNMKRKPPLFCEPSSKAALPFFLRIAHRWDRALVKSKTGERAAQTPPGTGDLFGIAMRPSGNEFYYVEDDMNTLVVAH
jgi:hypothetical protein